MSFRLGKKWSFLEKVKKSGLNFRLGLLMAKEIIKELNINNFRKNIHFLGFFLYVRRFNFTQKNLVLKLKEVIDLKNFKFLSKF